MKTISRPQIDLQGRLLAAKLLQLGDNLTFDQRADLLYGFLKDRRAHVLVSYAEMINNNLLPNNNLYSMPIDDSIFENAYFDDYEEEDETDEDDGDIWDNDDDFSEENEATANIFFTNINLGWINPLFSRSMTNAKSVFLMPAPGLVLLDITSRQGRGLIYNYQAVNSEIKFSPNLVKRAAQLLGKDLAAESSSLARRPPRLDKRLVPIGLDTVLDDPEIHDPAPSIVLDEIDPYQAFRLINWWARPDQDQSKRPAWANVFFRVKIDQNMYSYHPTSSVFHQVKLRSFFPGSLDLSALPPGLAALARGIGPLGDIGLPQIVNSELNAEFDINIDDQELDLFGDDDDDLDFDDDDDDDDVDDFGGDDFDDDQDNVTEVKENYPGSVGEKCPANVLDRDTEEDPGDDFPASPEESRDQLPGVTGETSDASLTNVTSDANGNNSNERKNVLKKEKTVISPFDLTSQLQKSLIRNREYYSKYYKTRKKNKKLTFRLNESEEQLKTSRIQLKAVVAERNGIQEALQKTQDENLELRLRLDKHAENAKPFAEEIQSLKNENAELKTKYDSTLRELEAADKKNEELSKDPDEVAIENLELMSSLDEALSKIKELESLSASQALAINDANQEKQESNKVIASLKLDLENSGQWIVPESLSDVVIAGKQYYSSKLIFHDRLAQTIAAFPQAESDKKHRIVMEAVKIVKALADTMYTMKFVDNNLSQELFQSITGIRFSMTERRATKRERALELARTCTYNGKKVQFFPHIKSSIQGTEFRVHFQFLDEERKILICHMGDHLPTAYTKFIN